MSEQLCVCGHENGEHRMRETGTVEFETHRPHLAHRCHCGCGDYRGCLPWPDSEGWWWCDDIAGPIMATKDVHGQSVFIDNEWLRPRDFERWNNGPARFTKLLENNPFTD